MLQIAKYEHTDIPPGMTCEEYRRLRMAPVPAPRKRLRLTALRNFLRL
jgi:hypothetical protein